MNDRDRAIQQMKAGDYSSALSLFQALVRWNPTDWSLHYMAGQCCRFLNDFDSAIAHLETAAELRPDEPTTFLALGIARQLNHSYAPAIEAFKVALRLDPDYDLAFNSLALTQKKMGHLDLALHNYDAGIQALARRIAKGMKNDRASRIFKHRQTPHNLWLEYALKAAMHLCSVSSRIDSLAWPTGEQAAEEERTEAHGGLYWLDTRGPDGRTTRLFLPNYLNTFREALKREPDYSNMLGNRGIVLELTGRLEEADSHFEEARYFTAWTG